MTDTPSVRPDLHPILHAMRSCAAYGHLLDALPAGEGRLDVGGLVGSASSAVLASLTLDLENRVVIAVAPDTASAASLEADLDTLLGRDVSYLYPQREALPYESSERPLEISGLRVEALEALFSGRSRMLVTTVRALQERAPIPKGLAELRVTLSVGDELGFSHFQETLRGLGFEARPLVEEVGHYAVRGGLIDVFSFGSPEPLRIEFWGDEISSIRTFDILDQRSSSSIRSAYLLPVDVEPSEDETASDAANSDTGDSDREMVHRSLLDLLPGDPLLVRLGATNWKQEIEANWAKTLDLHEESRIAGGSPADPSTLFLPPNEWLERIDAIATVHIHEDAGSTPAIRFDTRRPPAFERDTGRLQQYLKAGAAERRSTLILCDNQGQLDRLHEILEGAGGAPPRGTHLLIGSIQEGFLLPDSEPSTRVLTDHEIFRRARRIRRRRRFRGAVALESLAQLSVGDHVVHMDHGIGEFRGLEHIEIAGEEIEVVAIRYADRETLRVPVYRLDLIERWVGEVETTAPPALHKIGGRKWKATRERAEAAIREMTAELLELYARREAAVGYAFSADTRWQKEMESAFLYDDTPDQRTATSDVKRDMEARRPMDRLICGDVGYGKTEVAIRAAFKAVQDGKQVAVLAPTTILVEQHRHTFEERLADFPVRVAALSRFRKPTEQKEILEGIADGTVDIVVGTHRLLSEDVTFKDLGLLVVDEEQRFGVRHKERLKQFRSWVDVLTLSATPIPRTLHLSLSGLRDLSLIRTPPRDRMPIQTHVVPWSDHWIGEAMYRELDRGGQIFFLHNAVETIEAAADRVRELAPDARVEIGHGQMGAGALDRVMTDFVDGDVDILVCSTIIENGLDVPNANTLIVNRADRFGLTQLYQIRGRVGRSDRRAYCYLIVPEKIQDDADRRLRVLEHYTELGSGYSVALRDLEMRGSGNLLGADQSGFAHQVGLDTYFRLLEKTVEEIRRGDPTEDYPPPEISISGGAFLPDRYVSDSGQKLHLYRRFSRLESVEEAIRLREELTDRFGAPPDEVERLIEQAMLRRVGQIAGVERILIRDDRARLAFRPGVVPSMTLLDRALTDHLVHVEVRRLNPLALTLERRGSRGLADTLIDGLAALADAGSAVK